jgi:hypothetical protein
MSKGYHTWIPFALKSSKSSEVFCRCGWPFIELKVAESCGTDLSPGNIQAGQIFEKRYPDQIDRRWPKSTIDFNLPPAKSDSEELYIFSIMFSIPRSLKWYVFPCCDKATYSYQVLIGQSYLFFWWWNPHKLAEWIPNFESFWDNPYGRSQTR